MKRKKSEIYKEKALHYIDRVMSGERIAGRYEKLAVKRHLDDLRFATEKGLYFDEKAAKKALVFFTLLKHFKGEWAGTGIGGLAVFYYLVPFRLVSERRCPAIQLCQYRGCP